MRTADGKLVRMPMSAAKNSNVPSARSGVITQNAGKPVAPPRQSSEVVVILSDSSDDESPVKGSAKENSAKSARESSSKDHSEAESEGGRLSRSPKSGAKRKGFQLRVSLEKGGSPDSKRQRRGSGDEGGSPRKAVRRSDSKGRKGDAEDSDDGMSLSQRLQQKEDEEAARKKAVSDREARRLLRQARREQEQTKDSPTPPTNHGKEEGEPATKPDEESGKERDKSEASKSSHEKETDKTSGAEAKKDQSKAAGKENDKDSPSKASSDVEASDADVGLTNGQHSDNEKSVSAKEKLHNGDAGVESKAGDTDGGSGAEADAMDVSDDPPDGAMDVSDDPPDGTTNDQTGDASDASPIKDAITDKPQLNGKSDEGSSPTESKSKKTVDCDVDEPPKTRVVQVDGAPDRKDTSTTSDSSPGKHDQPEDLFASLSFEPLFEIQPMNSDSNAEAENEGDDSKVKVVKRSRADIEAQRVLHKELLEDSTSQSEAVDATTDDDSDDVTGEAEMSEKSSGDVYDPHQEKKSKGDRSRGQKQREKHDTALKGEIPVSFS